MFEEYYQDIISKTNKLYYNYIGINRKEYPKWEGWKIITKYKDEGIDVNEINDNTLNILVRNFYLLKYIQETNKED